jgi:hypothetical protein
VSTIPAPAPSRFLGIIIDDTLPSDLRYAYELLESKDPTAFFNGLKIITSIYESTDNKFKKEWTGNILSMLCRVMPSYVKTKDDIYELNKTKIDDAIRQGKHPLDLKRTLETARKSVQSGDDKSRFVVEQPTGIVMTAPPSINEDDIKILSIEDQSEQETKIAANVVDDIIAPGEENVDDVPELEPVLERARPTTEGYAVEAHVKAVPNREEDEKSAMLETTETLEFEKPGAEEDSDDEWVSASDFKSWIDEKVIYDQDGKVGKDLAKGLNLMNPMQHESDIDMNYSSSKGYHDVYRPQTAYTTPSPVPLPHVPEYTMTTGLPEEPAGVEIKAGKELESQVCGFGDGSIDPSDAKVYVCSNCKTAFHEGCGKLVLEIQGGICPACNHAW